MSENICRTIAKPEDNGLKFCSGCKLWKSKGDFNSDSKAKDGKSYRCRSCRKKHRRKKETRERTSKYNQKYAEQNPELMKRKDRKNMLKRFWNMTEEQFQTLLDRQNGTCALCDKTESNPNKALCIDHNHTTGEIRGLLCDNHNRALGLFNDSIEELEKAIEYLKKQVIETLDKKPA